LAQNALTKASRASQNKTMSEKQIKLVESIIYNGTDEQIKVVEKYIKDLLQFRKDQNA
jgi:hypothetical protein